MTATAELSTIRSRLLEAARELGDSVAFKLPAEEDNVGFEEAMRWVDRSLHAGLEVDYRVAPDTGGDAGEIWLMHWDPADPKPPWAEDWEDGELRSAD